MYEFNENEHPEDPYKFFFQIDTDWIAKYIDQIVKKLSESGYGYEITNIEGFPKFSLPVNGYFSSNTVSGENPLLYLGNNHYNEPIFKNQHFVKDSIKTEYINHIRSNAVHFLKQPNYYNGMFDILN